MDFRRIVERVMGRAPMKQHAATATVIGAAAGLFVLSLAVPQPALAIDPTMPPAALLLLPLLQSI